MITDSEVPADKAEKIAEDAGKWEPPNYTMKEIYDAIPSTLLPAKYPPLFRLYSPRFCVRAGIGGHSDPQHPVPPPASPSLVHLFLPPRAGLHWPVGAGP